MLAIIISIILIICFSAITYYIFFSEPDYRWFIITYRYGSTGEIKTTEEGLRCRKKDGVKLVKDKFLERYRYRGVSPTDIIQIKEVSIDEIRLELILKSSDGKQIVLIPW